MCTQKVTSKEVKVSAAQKARITKLNKLSKDDLIKTVLNKEKVEKKHIDKISSYSKTISNLENKLHNVNEILVKVPNYQEINSKQQEAIKEYKIQITENKLLLDSYAKKIDYLDACNSRLQVIAGALLCIIVLIGILYIL